MFKTIFMTQDPELLNMEQLQSVVNSVKDTIASMDEEENLVS